jgi:hypothetical protein
MPATRCAQGKDMAVEPDGGGVVMWWGKCSSCGCSLLGSRRAQRTGVISSLTSQEG